MCVCMFVCVIVCLFCLFTMYQSRYFGEWWNVVSIHQVLNAHHNNLRESGIPSDLFNLEHLVTVVSNVLTGVTSYRIAHVHSAIRYYFIQVFFFYFSIV